jgi:arylsulfatase A-like enzyme
LKAHKPNLLFVFADQWRKQAVGLFGENKVATPVIDRFAADGLTLTHAISCFPLCSPNRAIMLTGCYPLTTGVTTNFKPGMPSKLNDDAVTIGTVLKGKGYRTGYIGKWHLDLPEICADPEPASGAVHWDAYIPPGPRRFGFDYWYAYNANDRHMAPHYWKDTPEKIQVNEWSTKHETDVAIDFIRGREGSDGVSEGGGGRGDQPFALLLSWNPPHQPFQQVPAAFRERYAGEPLDLKPNHLEGEGMRMAEQHLRDYYAAVTATDEQFGRLLETLEQEGIADDTLVVLTSDHGELMGSHNWLEHKNIWYEESIRVPFFIRWPNKVKKGTDDALFNSVDIMPSLLGLLGLPIPEQVEGSDLSFVFRGEEGESPHSAFICHYPGGVGEYEQARLRGQDIHAYGWRGIRTPRYTYVVQRAYGSPTADRRLYDNERDPFQLTPTVLAEPPANGLEQELERELQSWLERIGDPFVLDEAGKLGDASS